MASEIDAAYRVWAEAQHDALVELIEVARLRGDNELPHPCDDPKLWTSRMIEAWGSAEEAADTEAPTP